MKFRIRAGLWAGFITVLLTTALLLAGRSISLLPKGMDLRDMALIIDPARSPGLALVVGAANHIAAGSIIGLLYGWLAPRFTPITGVAALLISWFSLMLGALPLSGRGLFGLHDGPSLAIWTLILHVAFGAILGWLTRYQLHAEENSG